MSISAITLREFASYAPQTATDTPSPTTHRDLDEAIARLREGAKRFVRLGIDERIRLAKSMQAGALRTAQRSVLAGCKAKGIVPGTPLEAEEWATGPWGVVRQLRLIGEALQSIKTRGNTPIGPVTRTADGRLSVGVFPGNGIDKILFKDVTVDVRMQAGIDEKRLDDTRASFYRNSSPRERVVMVLGAGNIAAIGPMDIVTKMFNEGSVCLLKMNPVNAYLGPYIEEAFADAIRQNFLAVVYGGADVGQYLVNHDGIDAVHITGSDKTHDAIVWGPAGPQREARKERNDPVLKKPISSELGNISPVIVVPGPYSEKELRYQAEDAASYLVMNASFLCNAAKMLVAPKGWTGSDTFLRGMEDVCAQVPPRQAYYPGAEDRLKTLIAGRSQVKQIGRAGAGTLPWTFVTGLNASFSSDPLFMVEPFSPVLSETRLGSDDPVAFLDEAVEFCNNTLWGTLSATLVVHPTSLKDPRIAAAVDGAIARLRYGSIGINGFVGTSFVFGTPPWGAYPGSTLRDIQSGQGFVHNTSMLEGVEKAVIRYPLTNFPKPGYFPTHRTSHKVVPRIVAMEENASWAKVPGIVINAMRG